MRTLEDCCEAIYELNCTYLDALGHTFHGTDDLHAAQFLTLQAIVMSLQGMPAFNIHSMAAAENDHEGVERRNMNRAINRHRWDYPALRAKLTDPETNQSTVLSALPERLKLRAQQPAFHPNATQFTLRLDKRVFGIWRQSLDRSQSAFALHNMSNAEISIPLSALNLIADEDRLDILSDDKLTEDQTAFSVLLHTAISQT